MTSRQRSTIIRRGVVVIAVSLTLVSAVSTVWAASPTTPARPQIVGPFSTVSLPSYPLVVTTPTPTGPQIVGPFSTVPLRVDPAHPLIVATPTSIMIVGIPGITIGQQPSMAGDAGSSMGADAPRMPTALAGTSVSMPATTTAIGPTRAASNAVVSSGVSPVTGAPTVTSTQAPAAAIACTPLTTGNAFAATGFQSQWQQGEAITPNFWGPAGTAGVMEPYADAAGGQRSVQYFDKGRMESAADGGVTNGLLATELITGQVQVGGAAFQAKTAPAIPIAGDPDNAGPTYAALGTTAASLLAPAPQSAQMVVTRVSADGVVSVGTASDDAATMLTSYDAATQHNVPQAFARYRDKAGLAAVGLAKSEPFFATVKVGGVPKQVMMQVFERRVLTYTADNDPAFRVEMGNIGQHYYRWRYCA